MKADTSPRRGLTARRALGLALSPPWKEFLQTFVPQAILGLAIGTVLAVGRLLPDPIGTRLQTALQEQLGPTFLFLMIGLVTAGWAIWFLATASDSLDPVKREWIYDRVVAITRYATTLLAVTFGLLAPAFGVAVCWGAPEQTPEPTWERFAAILGLVVLAFFFYVYATLGRPESKPTTLFNLLFGVGLAAQTVLIAAYFTFLPLAMKA